MLRVEDVIAAVDTDYDRARCQSEGRLDRVRQAPAVHVCLDHQAIDDDLDVVPTHPGQLDLVAQVTDFPVDARADKTLFARVFEHGDVFTPHVGHERSEDHDARRFRYAPDGVGDLLDGLTRNRPATVWAVGAACPCE